MGDEVVNADSEYRSPIDALVAAGHCRLRLPFWNEHAYIEPDVLPAGQIGPWCSVYDVGAGVGGGEPLRILTLVVDQDDRWEPYFGPAHAEVGEHG